jgi:hypothetical protein
LEIITSYSNFYSIVHSNPFTLPITLDFQPDIVCYVKYLIEWSVSSPSERSFVFYMLIPFMKKLKKEHQTEMFLF